MDGLPYLCGCLAWEGEGPRRQAVLLHQDAVLNHKLVVHLLCSLVLVLVLQCWGAVCLATLLALQPPTPKSQQSWLAFLCMVFFQIPDASAVITQYRNEGWQVQPGSLLKRRDLERLEL